MIELQFGKRRLSLSSDPASVDEANAGRGGVALAFEVAVNHRSTDVGSEGAFDFSLAGTSSFGIQKIHR
jgi:hypothetical protein